MTQKFANNFLTTIAATFGAGDTILSLASVAGLPSLAGGHTLLLTLFRLSGVVESGHEVVRVTSITGLTATVVRAVEGAAASQFNIGDKVGMRITAGSMQLAADHMATTGNPHGLVKADINLGNVDNTSDADKPVSTAQAAADTAAFNASKAYADTLIVGLWDDRGSFDASVNNFPATGGSGAVGAILKGDTWTVSVAGLISGVTVGVGQTIRALVNTPAQIPANWAISIGNTIKTPNVGQITSYTPTYGSGATEGMLVSDTFVVAGIAYASTFTYNADGTLNVETITGNGKTRTVTNTYSGGVYTGFTATEV